MQAIRTISEGKIVSQMRGGFKQNIRFLGLG